MATVAINGFGRIGRCVLRAIAEREIEPQLEVGLINESADIDTIAHLLKYDSTHGRFNGEISVEGDSSLKINGRHVSVSHSPLQGRKGSLENIDILFECSGGEASLSAGLGFQEAGATSVIFSQPGDSTIESTIVYGYNHASLSGGAGVLSTASCTTNCIVPVIDVLNEAFGIESGTITTIHSAMNDQPVIDAYHHTDLRKTRAAMQSIIPVDTELALGIERLMPEMAGRFSAQALRVPTVNVSAMDLTVVLGKEVTDTAEINAALSQAANSKYLGILGFTLEPLASCDFNHDSRSGVIDGSQTCLSRGNLAKVLVWFDNEWGYANRMVDTALYVCGL
jgi:glyceraldehyde-3-phosphate dehydrogenase type I